MIYPTGKSQEDFKKNWKIDQAFGNQTSYGFHEGVDISLKTGGNTDLGQPLYAVGDGKIIYYHSASHPTSGFGLHMVLEVETKFGKRWFHYCHCQKITNIIKKVKQGDQIGTLGKSGTELSHLHFACYLIDPSILTRGIDTIAQTEIELNKYWTSPLVLIDRLNEEEDNGNMNFIGLKKRLSDANWAELDEFSDLEKLKLIDKADSIQTMMMKWLKSNSDISITQGELLKQIDALNETVRISDQRRAELDSVVSERDKMITTLTNEINGLKNDLVTSQAEIDILLGKVKVAESMAEKLLLQNRELTEKLKIGTPNYLEVVFNFIKKWRKELT